MWREPHNTTWRGRGFETHVVDYDFFVFIPTAICILCRLYRAPISCKLVISYEQIFKQNSFHGKSKM